MSQTEFARLFGVKQQVLSSWEHGKAQPNVECIIAMCMVGGVSADWLLGLSDERGGGGVRVSGDGNAVASASPGARVAASASSAEVERLRGEVAIRPNLRAWLDAYPPAFPLLPKSHGAHMVGALHRALGIAWPPDGMRHSFATYAYEMSHDAAAVAAEMGHTGTAVFFKHYRALAAPGDGEKFFSIVPEKRALGAAFSGK